MRILLLLLLGIILIQLDYQKRSLNRRYTRAKTPQWIKKYKVRARSKWHYELFKATSLGIKNTRSHRENYQKIKSLNLYHLLTPSGLHLSILFIPIKGISLLFSIPLFIIFYFLSFLYPGFYSIKRILLYKIIRSLSIRLDLGINQFQALLLTIFFDILFGTFQYSPISFCLSFIFLLIFTQTNELSSSPLIIRIGFINYFISYFFQYSFTIFMPFASLIASTCFIPYFLSNFVWILFPTSITDRFHHIAHGLFFKCISSIYKLNQLFTSWVPDFGDFLIIIIFIGTKRIKRGMALMAILVKYIYEI